MQLAEVANYFAKRPILCAVVGWWPWLRELSFQLRTSTNSEFNTVQCPRYCMARAAEPGRACFNMIITEQSNHSWLSTGDYAV